MDDDAAGARLTIPEVVERFADYREMPDNAAWGILHCVLDDGNVRNVHVEWTVAHAVECGDVEGEALARILLRLTTTQRSRLPAVVDELVAGRLAARANAT